jgi:hypothetical protein
VEVGEQQLSDALERVHQKSVISKNFHARRPDDSSFQALKM